MMMLRKPIKLSKLYAEKYKDIFGPKYLPKIKTNDPFIIDSFDSDRTSGKNIIIKYIIADRNKNILDISNQRYIEIPEEGCLLIRLEAISFISYSVDITYIVDTDSINVAFPIYMGIEETEDELLNPDIAYRFDNLEYSDGNDINFAILLSDTAYLYDNFIKPCL